MFKCIKIMGQFLIILLFLAYVIKIRRMFEESLKKRILLFVLIHLHRNKWVFMESTLSHHNTVKSCKSISREITSAWRSVTGWLQCNFIFQFCSCYIHALWFIRNTLVFLIIVTSRLFFSQKKIALHALIRVLHD